MVTAATSRLSKPIDFLRDTIANSATFITWTGSANAAAAKLKVFVNEQGSPDEDLPLSAMPLAIVQWESFDRFFTSKGENNLFESDGSLSLRFYAGITDDDNEESALYEFLNNVGAVIDEMGQLAGTAGFLDITRKSMSSMPQRADVNGEQQLGKYYTMKWTVEYNDQ